jgi:hypothetical protein
MDKRDQIREFLQNSGEIKGNRNIRESMFIEKLQN